MAVGDMSAQLSEALSLLRTGQGELKAKADILDQATSSAENLESAWETVQKLQSNIATSAEEVLAFTEDVRTQKATADELVVEIDEMKSNFEKVLSENIEHTQHLADQFEQVKELQALNVAQQKLIEELLPKATSAGLAYGFQIRVDELQTTKYIWMVAFFASIVLLGVVAFINGPFIPDELKDPWLRLLYRLPMAASLIWFGWVSAVQYGNNIRLQEDYAFKAATSKAFAGYRDHMQHLADVKLEEANSAMTLLAAKTIEVLAHEPLRIFGKSAQDVHPAPSILERFLNIFHGSDGGGKK